MREALGVATSTNEKEVEVPPHMAEGSLGVLIDNSTVGTEGHLPSLSLNVKRLPHQAPMSVEVCQQELLSIPTWKSGGTTAVKLGIPVPVKADRAAGGASLSCPWCTRGPSRAPG